MPKKLIMMLVLVFSVVVIAGLNLTHANAQEVKLDKVINSEEMDLQYTSVVSGVTSIEDLANQGYIKMNYPNGKEVPLDFSGDRYTFLSYFNNVKVQEFATSYRIGFGFSTAISGATSANEYGSFIINKEDETTDLNKDWQTLTPEVDVQTDKPTDEVEKLDTHIAGKEMQLYYTSTVTDITSVQELFANGYVKMYYPNGKEVPLDYSGVSYTLLSYFNDVNIQEFNSSYRVSFAFSTSMSGATSANEYGSFIVLK
ncbi:MAG: hypothetical protein ACK5HR_04955 [Mycoplasmatales bacterium]